MPSTTLPGRKLNALQVASGAIASMLILPSGVVGRAHSQRPALSLAGLVSALEAAIKQILTDGRIAVALPGPVAA
jgi:hypothetical protein